MTRDLIREQFSEIDVSRNCNIVSLTFKSALDAEKAYFVIKNAMELGLPIQIRKQFLGECKAGTGQED